MPPRLPRLGTSPPTCERFAKPGLYRLVLRAEPPLVALGPHMAAASFGVIDADTKGPSAIGEYAFDGTPFRPLDAPSHYTFNSVLWPLVSMAGTSIARSRGTAAGSSVLGRGGLCHPVKGLLHDRHSRVDGTRNSGRRAVREEVGYPDHLARSIVIGRDLH